MRRIKITENELRSLTRKLLIELFTKKNPLTVGGFLDKEVNPYDYGDSYGGDFYGGDGGDLGEVDEAEDLEEDEEELA